MLNGLLTSVRCLRRLVELLKHCFHWSAVLNGLLTVVYTTANSLTFLSNFDRFAVLNDLLAQPSTASDNLNVLVAHL